jgi:ferredoxin
MKSGSRPSREVRRAFFKEADLIPNFTLFDRIHGYIYARWPHLYIGIGIGQHPIVKFFTPIIHLYTRIFPSKDLDDPNRHTIADEYHGKVLTTELATQLITVNEDIHLPDLEQVIPYPTARDIILKNPDHIVALECPCRSARENPCQPLDVCLVVGEPFASFIAESQPERSHWITQTEAVEILTAERDRGHVTHAFFKDAMLQRYYAICNCCECCCGAMNAHRNGTPMLASSGFVAQIDEDLCIGCADCEATCPFHAITLDDGWAVVNFEACMGCGVCETHCFQGAISMRQDEKKGIPLEIYKLMEEASLKS